MINQTCPEWLHLKAGRDLDKLISEKLGYAVETITADDLIGYKKGLPTSASLPRWSLRLEAALSLFDNIEELSYLDLRFSPSGDMAYGREFTWIATVSTGSVIPGIGKADTPALALCRAWLAYMENK